MSRLLQNCDLQVLYIHALLLYIFNLVQAYNLPTLKLDSHIVEKTTLKI